jgi:hypothetical protein
VLVKNKDLEMLKNPENNDNFEGDLVNNSQMSRVRLMPRLDPAEPVIYDRGGPIDVEVDLYVVRRFQFDHPEPLNIPSGLGLDTDQLRDGSNFHFAHRNHLLAENRLRNLSSRREMEPEPKPKRRG